MPFYCHLRNTAPAQDRPTYQPREMMWLHDTISGSCHLLPVTWQYCGSTPYSLRAASLHLFWRRSMDCGTQCDGNLGPGASKGAQTTAWLCQLAVMQAQCSCTPLLFELTFLPDCDDEDARLDSQISSSAECIGQGKGTMDGGSDTRRLLSKDTRACHAILTLQSRQDLLLHQRLQLLLLRC